MKRKIMNKILAGALAVCLLAGTVCVFPIERVMAATITIDGDGSDWGEIGIQSSSDVNVPLWAVSQDENYVYIMAQDINGNQWERPLTSQEISIAYANGYNGEQCGVKLDWNGGTPIVRSSWWNAIEGANVACRLSEDTTQGTWEIAIPKSYFADSSFTVTYCGASVSSGDIVSVGDMPSGDNTGENVEESEDAGGTENTGDAENAENTDGAENTETGDNAPTEEQTPTEVETPDKQEPSGSGSQVEENPRYEGITIDGDFSDWAAVSKYDVNENKGYSTVDQVAMVWDGDMIYLYFMSNGNGDGTGDWGSVTGAGSHNNGQYAITTDLGRSLLIQLSRDNNGSVAGVDGAQVAVNTTEWAGAPFMWEVSIPSSALPEYKNTISFGLYLGDVIISDVANFSPSQDGDLEDDNGSKDFNGIKNDGLYGDWEYYPHQIIQYATSGTQEHVADGEGALYSHDGRLYAHVVTNMPAHIQEAGGEFTSAVTIRLNGKEENGFCPQFVAVDSAGNIKYDAKLSGLSYGTYELYLIDSEGWKTATNISQLQTPEGRAQYHNAIYGHMYMTIGASKDEMEFEVDLSLLAELFGMTSDEIRTVDAQWGKIGNQWVSTAGTSTGTWIGLLICFAAVGLSSIVANKRKKMAG